MTRTTESFGKITLLYPPEPELDNMKEWIETMDKQREEIIDAVIGNSYETWAAKARESGMGNADIRHARREIERAAKACAYRNPPRYDGAFKKCFDKLLRKETLGGGKDDERGS